MGKAKGKTAAWGLVGCLSLLTAAANWGFAMGGSAGGAGGSEDGGLSGGGFSCTYNDAGFEEHFGGHGSCSSCLKSHGECNEECSATSFACSASGTSLSGNGGTMETAEGYSDFSESDARDRALDRCVMAGNKNCVVDDCEPQRKLISSRSCRH